MSNQQPSSQRRYVIVGAIFMAIGGLFLLDLVFNVVSSNFVDTYWPVLLVIAGVMMMLISRQLIGPGVIVSLLGMNVVVSRIDSVEPGFVQFLHGVTIIAIGLLIVLFFGGNSPKPDSTN